MSDQTAAMLRAIVMEQVPRYVDIEEQGRVFRVLEPSLRVRDTYLGYVQIEGAGKDSSVKADLGKLSRSQVELVIGCTYDPGSNQRVFKATDAEALLDRPASGLVAKLAAAASEFLNTAGDAGKEPSTAATTSSVA